MVNDDHFNTWKRETIVLDVEGVLFKTRVGTLVSVPGAYFARLLSKDWSRALDRDGRLFLDRDATIFPVILNFLRDGNRIPLPTDTYFLQRIRHEANYYGLLELVERIDRILPGKPVLNSDQKPGESSKAPTLPKKKILVDSGSPASSKISPTKEEKNVRFGSSPTLVPLGNTKRLSIEEPPLPTKNDTKAVRKGDSISQIGLPKNFAHVAHVGWNGDGVIFEKHLLADGETVRKIIEAAAQSVDDTPIYNVINGASEEYGSHSIEVVLAGPHIQPPRSIDRSEERKNSRESPFQNPSPPADPSQTLPNRPPKPTPKPSNSILKSNL